MSDINPSLVSSELTTIETFKDTTEKRGSKLTLNELNYISDKQLHQKTDGEGGGGSSSPVGLAKVTLLPAGSAYRLSNVFDDAMFARYSPEGDYLPTVDVWSGESVPFNDWNARMEDGTRIVTPQVFYMKNTYEYEIDGAAEIKHDDGNYIYITGDCTITVSNGTEA